MSFLCFFIDRTCANHVSIKIYYTVFYNGVHVMYMQFF